MKTDEKVGFACLAALLIVVLVVIWAIWWDSMPVDVMMYREVRGLCLECGYPKYKLHDGAGYCLRIEAGYDVIVPVEEACPQRVEQGKGKPQ